MRKFLLLPLLGLLLACHHASGQQDPMFTNYFFNSLIFNPAVAGTNNHLTAHLIHRSQWLGLEGAPTTQSLSVHSPMKNERVGVGLSLVNDKIGASGTFDLNAAYAYHFSVGKKMKLSIGLQAGLTNWRGTWSKLLLEDRTDDVFSENLNVWKPNFGTGLFLHGERFFAGLGCPRLLEHDLRANDGNASVNAQNYRHYYSIIGAAFPLGSELVVFRPSALLKTTGLFSKMKDNQQALGAPTALDVNASFFFHKMLWVGLAYRTALELSNSSNDSADLWTALYFRNGLRLGASYDLPLSKLNKVNNGSFELMAGYEFDIKVKRVTSPRYF
ncbi:MAG: type IX secretion system membrane protein PorP/SprF [Saprospiraceae bacterium]|nr:type IX secretion system membrane protein PorP/SprF [Saprospiraceae bacterium]